MSTGHNHSPRTARSFRGGDGAWISADESREAERELRHHLMDHPVVIEAAELMIQGTAPESFIDEAWGVPSPNDRAAVHARGQVMRAVLDRATNNGTLPIPSTHARREAAA